MSNVVQPALEALAAVKGIAEDVLSNGSPVRRSPLNSLSPLDLAIGFRRMQHAEFVHFMRCDASREALKLILRAVEVAESLIAEGDPQLTNSLVLLEPYRHRLYAIVTGAALRAFERRAVQREMAERLRGTLPRGDGAALPPG